MKSKAINAFHIILVVGLAWGLGYSVARGQEGPSSPADPSRWTPETGFSYQGSLKQAGSAVNANCDFQFGLWDAQSLGTQVGMTQTLTSQSVANGLFSVKLNGGGEYGKEPFNGGARWLAIAVRCPAGGGSYTSLSPQEMNATPVALFSLNAAMAGDFTGSLAGDVTGMQSSTTVTRLQGRGVASSAPVSGQMLKYDGAQWAPGGYKGLVIVAKSGGNFTSIQAALDSIADASDTNRYLVKVMPGVYTETVTMKAYVDIEGAGELATKITYTGDANYYGTLRGASNAELRFLTVENTGGGASFAVAISNNSASPRLTHITAKASGGTSQNFGVYNYTSAPAMTSVTASASGGGANFGVWNSYSSPVMTNVASSASGGDYSYGVYNISSSAVMTNVTASASGGSSINCGVYNDGGSPAMTNVTASASGGSGNNSGVCNTTNSSPVMTNVTASASGGTYNYGVYNSSSSPVIQNSVLRASGGSINYGLYNIFSYSTSLVTVINSQVIGSNATIYNNTGVTTRVGATLLDGGAVSIIGGAVRCAGVYDEAFVFYASTCP